MPLYRSNRETLRPERLFFLNIASQKSCWVRAESHEASFRRKLAGGGGYVANSSVTDGWVAVRAAAADGADLWIDTELPGQVFFTDRLRQALKAPTIRQPFRFHTCKIIDGPMADGRTGQTGTEG